jgi:hypothetical protein
MLGAINEHHIHQSNIYEHKSDLHVSKILNHFFIWHLKTDYEYKILSTGLLSHRSPNRSYCDFYQWVDLMGSVNNLYTTKINTCNCFSSSRWTSECIAELIYVERSTSGSRKSLPIVLIIYTKFMLLPNGNYLWKCVQAESHFHL